MKLSIEIFFDDYNIKYATSGKNATQGWIQITCPWEDCNDSSDHLGINLESSFFHCWICRKKGSFPFLVTKLLDISINQAEKILKKYEDFPKTDKQKNIQNYNVDKISIIGFEDFHKMHIEYLKNRNFNPSHLKNTYQIGGFGTWGRFPYSIGIPVYQDAKLVNFTSRAITNQQKRRYETLKNDESIMPIKQCVYNIDSCKQNETILIVEGPFDTWRIGGSTVSFFGTEFKTAQILKVLSKSPKRIFILFDQNAEAHAENLAYSFSPFTNSIEILELPSNIKDPAELSPDEGLSIRNELRL